MRRQSLALLGPAALSLVFAATAAGYLDQGAPQQSEPITRVVTQRTPSDSFDWLDAAIGGAAVLGLVLISAGTSLVALRRPQQRVLVDTQPTRKEQHP
jgi:hypothetical protein